MKYGDKIKCVSNVGGPGDFTVGKTYIVDGLKRGEMLWVVADDHGFRNAMFSHRFESVPQPKFKPGDVVSNNNPGHRATIRRVKDDAWIGAVAYDYQHEGWDYERSLTLVQRFEDNLIELAKAGKKIEAIKAHRAATGCGLKESKDFVEALDLSPTLGDILSTALAPFKIGDRVSIGLEYGSHYLPDHGTVTDTRSNQVMVKLDDGTGCETWFGVEHIKRSDEPAPNPAWWASPSIPAIVVRKDSRGYHPNTNPMVHGSVELAKKEAERLALANPGVEFVTFVVASRSTATTPVAGTVTTVAA